MRTYGSIRYDAEQARPQWVVQAEPHVMVRLKRLFPRVNVYRRGRLSLVDTPEVAADLSWVLERWPMELDDVTRARLSRREREYLETRDAVTSILDGHIPHLDLQDPALPPRDYQLAPSAIVWETGRLLLCDDLGTGKTFSGLLTLRNPEALPALVVTLTHLPQQWLRELERFLPWLSGHVLTKGRPYDVGNPDVVITNYHKLSGWQHHLAGKVRTVIFDEAQELRHDGTQKYEAAAHIADNADFVMGLTATPVYNYGGEIFSLVRVLDPEVLGSKEEFNREWCHGDGMKQVVSDPAALGSYLREEGVMLRRSRRDVGRELPEVQRIVHAIDLDTDRLEKESEGVEELAELILSKAGSSTDLWKAAGDLDWRLRHATGVAKAKYVSSFTRLLLDAGEPVVLFGWHRDVYEFWAADLFSLRPAFYTGSESPTAKERARDDFLSGRTNLLIMSLRSGAGLDGLQERAHVAVFGELDWSPGVHEQCIGRLHRDGQDDPVVAYFLVADEGSDPAVAEVLNLKQMQSRPIVDPAAAPITEAALAQDRVRLLAEEYLRRKRGELAVVS